MLKAPTKLPQIQLFGMTIDAVSMQTAAERLSLWIAERCRPCRYVVTPNVDHAVLFQEQERLRAAYKDASLVVADGFPLVVASRLLRRPVPERVAGSDLVPALFRQATESDPMNTFLLGAAPGVAERAARQIEQRWPNVRVTDFYSPPLGFERDPNENEKILSRIAAVPVDCLVVGLGAPKQELWVHAHWERIEASVALCAGATIDFLAGEKRRAPKWMQRCGMEWCHRMLTEPRRLVRRYARDAWIFPRLLWHEWRR